MRYLITGGTGSLGKELVEYLTADIMWNEVIVFSRDEQKQFNMKVQYKGKENEERIKYVLGDIRDYETVDECMSQYKPDAVIHTAAQKHVHECDVNPMQAVKTNIEGTKNVGKACIVNKVGTACLISTDKAPDPTTLYGMTKHIAERLWVNFQNGNANTRFTGVRYGNILNSAGSLIPLYQKIAEMSEKPEFPLTNPEMTRFFMTYPMAINLIMSSLGNEHHLQDNASTHVPLQGISDRMFLIPQAISARIGDIAELFAEKYNGTVIHKDAVIGEKIHEILLPDFSSKDCVVSKDELKEFLIKNGVL